jgi:hypothetical protein
MIVVTASSSSLLGATTSVLGACPPALHERAPAAASSPPLGSSPSSRSHSLTICASAACLPRCGARAASGSSTRFAPALSRARTGKRQRRGGGGGGDADGGVWGDDEFFCSGPWDGFDDAGFGGSGSGHGRGGGGGGGGGGGSGSGGGGWDRRNSEFGDWPALAGASWIWQGVCVASLVHSFFFMLFPAKGGAEPAAMPPFSGQPRVEGLC